MLLSHDVFQISTLNGVECLFLELYTHLHNNRYSVKNLLDHEFFAENVKFELLEADENEGGGGGLEDPILNMRMELPTKELTAPKTNKGQESIEFVYDLHKDDPAEVVNEMVSWNTATCGTAVT